MAQMGFFDLSDRYASLDAKKDPLLEIDQIVPWEDFRPLLKKVWRKPLKDRKSRAGRKPWDEIIMFKALVLSALYNLSDDQIEFQVRDRLSFMRFLGLGLEDRVPDAKTVWAYREDLVRAGKFEELLPCLTAILRVRAILREVVRSLMPQSCLCRVIITRARKTRPLSREKCPRIG